MGSIIDSTTKVLMDPWNHEFSTPQKCLASLVTTILFPTLIFHISSAVWRHYRKIEKNDTQDAISEKISALFQTIFSSTIASSFIPLKNILKEEEFSQLRLYSEKPLPKDAKLPDFINLQRPITTVQQMGDDGKVKTFMAFKILADIQSKENPNGKWINQSVMYLQVSEDNLTAVCLMQDPGWDVVRVDEKNQLALLNAIIHDAEFKQEDDHLTVSYRLSPDIPSCISTDTLENKNLANALKTNFGFTELPLYSKEPLSKEAELPDFRDLQEPITIVKIIGDGDKIHNLMAFKVKAFGESEIGIYGESSSSGDFLVLYAEVDEEGVYSVCSASGKWPTSEITVEDDDQGRLFRAIIDKTPFNRKHDNYNISYKLTSYQYPK